LINYVALNKLHSIWKIQIFKLTQFRYKPLIICYSMMQSNKSEFNWSQLNNIYILSSYAWKTILISVNNSVEFIKDYENTVHN